METNAQDALCCSGIKKRFGNVLALTDAFLQVQAGTIHAVLGENGAGKSTLINIISGLLKADSGKVEIFGQEAHFTSALDAVSAGIGMVHQHFLLAEALTVAENVALGVRTSPAGLYFDRRVAENATAELSAATGLNIDPRARVADLPVGMRQRVEILKALSRGAKILLLDEPTAVLAPPEVDTLFKTLHSLREAGRTIVIVTHKLDEVFALASEATVLRRGATVFSGKLAGLTSAALAEKMIPGSGAAADLPATDASVALGAPLFELRVHLPRALEVDSLSIKAGEIVGVAGVEGNGQQELADCIVGMRALPPGSEISLNGRSLTALTIRERAESGIAFIPPDRQREGLVLEMTLSENLHLRHPLVRRTGGIETLDHSAMETAAESILSAHGVMPAQPELEARALSGGNQQKVVVARELSSGPALIVACNPTRGLDIAAARSVQRRLTQAARERGAAILLLSSDLDEVLQLSDRVCVLYRGKLSEAGARGVGKESVGRAMVGA